MSLPGLAHLWLACLLLAGPGRGQQAGPRGGQQDGEEEIPATTRPPPASSTNAAPRFSSRLNSNLHKIIDAVSVGESSRDATTVNIKQGKQDENRGERRGSVVTTHTARNIRLLSPPRRLTAGSNRFVGRTVLTISNLISDLTEETGSENGETGNNGKKRKEEQEVGQKAIPDQGNRKDLTLNSNSRQDGVRAFTLSGRIGTASPVNEEILQADETKKMVVEETRKHEVDIQTVMEEAADVKDVETPGRVGECGHLDSLRERVRCKVIACYQDTKYCY